MCVCVRVCTCVCVCVCRHLSELSELKAARVEASEAVRLREQLTATQVTDAQHIHPRTHTRARARTEATHTNRLVQHGCLCAVNMRSGMRVIDCKW